MSVLHLATAAAVAVLPTAAAPVLPSPEPPAPVIVVQLCLSVTVEQVDEILAQLDEGDLVDELAPLTPITVPDGGDPVGLDLVPAVDVPAVHAVLNCGTVTPPPTTEPPVTTEPAPTTEPDPTTEPAPTTTDEAPADRDCPDFATQADAQAALDASPDDAERLDSDGDGIACETEFGSDDPDVDPDGDGITQIRVTPRGGVATGDGSLAA